MDKTRVLTDKKSLFLAENCPLGGLSSDRCGPSDPLPPPSTRKVFYCPAVLVLILLEP
jgi:hypothetical protein